MNKHIKSFIVAAVLFALPAVANAGIPWGTVVNVTGATPTATTFTSAPVVIDTLSTTQTSLTISGGTAGSFYTLIVMQDGTGSRTFTPPTNVSAASFFNGGVLPTVPSAANAYTVWVLQAVGATPTYQLVNAFDNLPLNNTFVSTQATLGTAVANGVTQSQGSVVIPGVTLATVPICQAQTTPATWQTGIALDAICGTNFCQCQEVNPTAATITPATVTLNIRITNP